MKTCRRGAHQYTGRYCPDCQRTLNAHYRRMAPVRSKAGPWNVPPPPHTLDVLRWETFKATIIRRIEAVRFEDRVAARGAAS